MTVMEVIHQGNAFGKNHQGALLDFHVGGEKRSLVLNEDDEGSNAT